MYCNCYSSVVWFSRFDREAALNMNDLFLLNKTTLDLEILHPDLTDQKLHQSKIIRPLLIVWLQILITER